MRDKKEIRMYGVHGNKSIHQYALFFFICLALRRKRKYNREKMYQDNVNNKVDQNKLELESNLNSFVSNNLDMTSANLARTNAQMPIVSTFDDNDDFEREEKTKPAEKSEFYSQMNKAKIGLIEEQKVQLDDLEEIPNAKLTNILNKSNSKQKFEDADTGVISQAERDKIESTIKKKKKKRRTTPKEEDKLAAHNNLLVEPMQRITDNVSDSDSVNTTKKVKKKLKRRRKASHNEEASDKLENDDAIKSQNNEEMEGGKEETNNEYNDYDFNSQFQENPNDQDTGVSVKKRKKKVLKKKLKKKVKKPSKQADEINTSPPVYYDVKDQIVMYSNVKEYETKGKFPETIDTVAQATEVNQTQEVNANENELTLNTKPDLTPPDKKNEIIVEKASERHYDGKRY